MGDRLNRAMKRVRERRREKWRGTGKGKRGKGLKSREATRDGRIILSTAGPEIMLMPWFSSF